MEGKIEEIEIKGDSEVFLRVKQKAEELYKSILPIYCPYFKDKVHFNTKGLDHIKFKEWNKPRTIYDQFLRFKLLNLVPQVITSSTTVQGIWRRKEWDRVKRHARWEKKPLDVNYYEFVSVIGKIRLKVVIKEIVGGEKFFWSIIPFWGMNKVTNNRNLHYKDLEYDGNIVSDLT
jgi:hypothetical protein